jgi:hypothetical protein
MPVERIGTAAAVPSPERMTGPRSGFLERLRPAPLPPRLEIEPRRVAAPHAPRVDPGAWLARIAAAQARMDRILALAASGRTFSPAELLSLQAGVAEASQTVDLAGKVLDRVSGGVKTLLQTQV